MIARLTALLTLAALVTAAAGASPARAWDATAAGPAPKACGHVMHASSPMKRHWHRMDATAQLNQMSLMAAKQGTNFMPPGAKLDHFASTRS